LLKAKRGKEKELEAEQDADATRDREKRAELHVRASLESKSLQLLQRAGSVAGLT
jgi:hypothetical protein